MTMHSTNSGVKIKNKTFFTICVILQKETVLESVGFLLPLTTGPNYLAYFYNLPEHLLRSRVCDSDSITIILPGQHALQTHLFFFSFFLNLIRSCTIPKLPLLPVREEIHTLHPPVSCLGRDLRETESLSWRLRIQDPTNTRGILFSFWGDPASKTKSTDIFQAKRSGHTPGNSIEVIPLTLPRALSLKFLHRRPQSSPCAALESLYFSTTPVVFQPTTSPSHAKFSSLSPHELLGGKREHDKCTRKWKHHIF